MSQDRRFGTAWVRCLEDYAFTNDFGRGGWAWEFLRRNRNYHEDFVAGHCSVPIAIQAVDNTEIFEQESRSLAAEKWGLIAFCDPAAPAHVSKYFWLPRPNGSTIFCAARESESLAEDTFWLRKIEAKIRILRFNKQEYVLVYCHRMSVEIVSDGPVSLINPAKITFKIEDLSHLTRQTEALQNLRYLMHGVVKSPSTKIECVPKYRDYLVALDGYLEGRSYRDIAVVLYGEDRVGETWSLDTQGLKSRVRRAVANGIHLMNGGYRNLL